MLRQLKLPPILNESINALDEPLGPFDQQILIPNQRHEIAAVHILLNDLSDDRVHGDVEKDHMTGVRANP